MSGPTYKDVYDVWRKARAFVIDNFVCGDYSVPSPEELADAEEAEESAGYSDFMPCASFYVYGEHGLKREYFIERNMIEQGAVQGDRLTLTYSDRQPLEIVPLFERGSEP